MSDELDKQLQALADVKCSKCGWPCAGCVDRNTAIHKIAREREALIATLLDAFEAGAKTVRDRDEWRVLAIEGRDAAKELLAALDARVHVVELDAARLAAALRAQPGLDWKEKRVALAAHEERVKRGEP